MAVVKSVTIRYGEKRAGEFQTCEVQKEITLEIESGDNVEDVMAQELSQLQKECTAYTLEQVQRLIKEKAQQGWK